MHDALFRGINVIELDAELGAILAEGFHLLGGNLIEDRKVLRCSRHVVINRRDRSLRLTHTALCFAQTVERLGRSDLMHEMKIDVEKGWLVVRRTHDVRIP